VENLEASIGYGRLRALLQMATGGGKTFTAISASYRLITQGGATRVLFLGICSGGGTAHLELQPC
jgi:type I restriction enzyme R subunit